MGVLDLSNVFDILDPSCRGYLTSTDVQQYDELLHTLPLCLQQVEAAIRQICSQTNGVVNRENFILVLQDLDRRRALEEQLHWDFLGLDQSGTGQLPLRETLLLFSMSHGDSFSMQTWQQFLKDRGENRDCDVYFDEVKVWLCDHPEGPPATARQIMTEEQRLTQLKDSQTQQQLFRCIHTGDEATDALSKQDYDDTTKKLARRKFHRWEREGVEGLLYDDGIDHGEEVTAVVRGRIGITEMKEVLQLKYDLLRKKLFWDMLRRSIGAAVFNSLQDTEKIEKFRQIQVQEKQMREEGFLDTQVSELAGAQLPHECSLLLYMGELREPNEKRRNDMYSTRLGLRAKNKSDQEIDRILRETYEKEFKGPVNCADMLISLDTRFLQERDWILSKLRSDTLHKWTNKQLTTEYCLLIRQHMLCELEEDLYPSCMAVGIAEREQEYKPDRYTPDRLRQEQLAKSRLAAYTRGQKSKFPYEDADVGRDRSKNTLELKLDVVKEVVWKHVMEREALTDFLHGPDFNVLKHNMQKMSDEQRNRHVITLRNQRNKWREYSAGYRASQRSVHVKVLQEGVALYFELTRLERVKFGERNISDEQLSMYIMADLQQKQDMEFYSVVQQMQAKTDTDSLLDVKRTEQRARREEVFDNVAGVVLGTERWTEDERPFLDAVEAKYNALRHLLYSHVLQLEHGVSWHRLSDKERARFIDRKSAEEVKLREAGQLEPMVKLIERLPKDFGSLRILMGEDRSEYGRRMKELNEFTEQAAVTGKEVDPTLKDEQRQGQVKSINLLGDMVRRAQVEEDALIAQLRTRSDLSLQEKLVPLVLLKIEIRRAERQERFDIGALSIGLMERITGSVQLSFRQKSDQERLYKLARSRVECRRRRIEAGRHYRKEIDESKPDEGDTMGWMEAYVRERDKKHKEEMEILLTVLQDAGMEELTEAAKTMSDDEKHKRLAELQGKRNRMNMSNREHQDENISILEEAAAIRFVIKKSTLEKEQKRELTVDEVSTSLLAEVQEVQEKEMAGAISRLGRMDYEDLMTARNLEIEARHWGSADNVVFVLTQYEGEAEDKVILQALEDKYDSLREKLLHESLQRDKEYTGLNDTEKHRKLVQLKLQETKLRKEGKYDELTRVVRIKLQGDDALHKLLGETRLQYEKRFKRLLAGIPSAEEEEEDPDIAENVFEMLQQRFESEREALLAMIRGSSGVILGGSQRQVVLVRLRYERRQVVRETQCVSAALALGLAERQQSDVDKRNKTDRWRQERLCCVWLEHMATTSQKWKDTNDVFKDGSVTELKNAVIERLEEKHRQEVDLLLDWLKAKVKGDLQALAENMSEVEKQNKLEELKEKRAVIHIDKTKDQHALLIEASVYKKMSRTVTLTFTSSIEGRVQEQQVTLSLVTDLREKQYMETEQYLQKLLSAEHQELIILQTKIIQEKKVKVANNVAEVLLCPEQPKEAGEHQLVQALENKYDTLKDKILAEALIAQMGENEWQKLTERERQRKLIELRMKEKKLRSEGRIEEANKLLGNMLQDQEKLQRLMGVNREEYDMKLAEKLARRKQRLGEGFTEEEVAQLEAEEQKKEGKKINVLADLDVCFEKEKEALLKTLDKYKESVEEQKVKQMELSRLKREQRKAREEEKFSAAALYISMAREQQEKMTDHRQRQEELARERLQQKLKKKRRAAPQTAEVPPPEDQSDEVGWQEAVTKEMEMKHAEEREILIQLLMDPQMSKLRQGLKQAETTTQTETRLEELRLLRNLWRQNGEKDSTEHVNMLKEACALCVELQAQRLPANEDKSDDALQVLLLANLQEHQDTEMSRVLQGLPDKSVESLRQMKTSHEVSRKQQWYENVATILMKPTDAPPSVDSKAGPSEKDVLDALEAKYDTLTTKLLEKVLRSQVGEEGWSQLSASEQQARIVKLRLEDRQLRVEGKHKEANQLFGDIIADPELAKTLGDSRSEQRRMKEERLRVKKQLVAERKQQGLSLNEALLESILDEQEKQAELNRKWNVLQQLQEHFDDEKQVVLSSLQNCESAEEAQKTRQLELARLTREQKKLAQEEDFRAAAALLNLDQQQERANAPSELHRQKALALARLNARRKLTQQKTDLTDLEEEESHRLTEQANVVSALDAEDLVALQAIVLIELELKQTRERESLVEFIHGSQTNQEVKQWLNTLSLQDKKFELECLRQERRKWKTACLQKLAQKMETNKEAGPLSTVEKEAILQTRQAQNQTLLRATALRLQVEKEDLQVSATDDELAVKLLVDLQQKQTLEHSAVSRVAAQQAEMCLKQLRDTQITSTRERWLDNLVSVLFTYTPLGGGAEDEVEEAEPEKESPDDRQLIDDMEEEFRQEKQNLIDRLTGEGKSQELILEELKRLEGEQESRKDALMGVLGKQKSSQKARLEARKQSEANREYEEEIAMQMSKISNREMSFIQKPDPRNKQGDMMSIKIQERRESRRRAAGEDFLSPPSTADRKRSKSIPGGFGMRREKTVVNVDLSDEKINETQRQLMRDVAARNRTIAMEQRLHEDRLQRRISEMKQKRNLGVQEVMETMERQRSNLEGVQTDERIRQIQKTKEEVEERRRQMTRNLKDAGSKNISEFKRMLADAGDTIVEAEEGEDGEGESYSQRRKSEGDAIRLLSHSKMEMKRKMKPDFTEYDIV